MPKLDRKPHLPKQYSNFFCFKHWPVLRESHGPRLERHAYTQNILMRVSVLQSLHKEACFGARGLGSCLRSRARWRKHVGALNVCLFSEIKISIVASMFVLPSDTERSQIMIASLSEDPAFYRVLVCSSCRMMCNTQRSQFRSLDSSRAQASTVYWLTLVSILLTTQSAQRV